MSLIGRFEGEYQFFKAENFSGYLLVFWAAFFTGSRTWLLLSMATRTQLTR